MSAHILIIEDNEMSLALAEYLLRQSGYTTSSATDGGSGVRLALENKANLILCDLDLPVIDGPQVVNTLRTTPDWRRVPILAFTAASLSDEQRQTLAANFDGCIVKPINPASFSTTVGQHLQPHG
ncbi:MAG TPA: response regulator [Steroidobacter sp.]|uniref:response regulator n=1 Tax=Steroidobacter sp. TaxID=1978227 RepID=UPI002ED7A673